MERRNSESTELALTCRYSTPSMEAESAMLFPDIEAQIAPPPYKAGDNVEVLRSDGAWQPAQVRRLQGEYYHCVWDGVQGDMMKKQIHLSIVSRLMRPAQNERLM
eukprot:Hpha_TRINITY_DN16199_c4_g1::TRINITY_DN16199_c4_g1_i1::g.7297::m.7297